MKINSISNYSAENNRKNSSNVNFTSTVEVSDRVKSVLLRRYGSESKDMSMFQKIVKAFQKDGVDRLISFKMARGARGNDYYQPVVMRVNDGIYERAVNGYAELFGDGNFVWIKKTFPELKEHLFQQAELMPKFEKENSREKIIDIIKGDRSKSDIEEEIKLDELFK